jgi:hypothetical protein
MASTEASNIEVDPAMVVLELQFLNFEYDAYTNRRWILRTRTMPPRGTKLAVLVFPLR